MAVRCWDLIKRRSITHSFTTTAANEHDLNQTGNLLHGEEDYIFADVGYRGAEKRQELRRVKADWHIAERAGTIRTLKQHPRINKDRIEKEYLKASIRTKVEHPFRHYQMPVLFYERPLSWLDEKP